jgi:hypothetical protein
MSPNPKLLCDDRLATDEFRASGRQHPVQHSQAEGSLGLLASKATIPGPVECTNAPLFCFAHSQLAVNGMNAEARPAFRLAG